MPIKVIIITTISSINVYISSTNQLIYYVERSTRTGTLLTARVCGRHNIMSIVSIH